MSTRRRSRFVGGLGAARGRGRWGVWAVAGWAALAVICTQVPPRWWWPTAFGALSLPLALAVNAGLLTVLAARRRWLAVGPLVVLVLGWGYVQRGFAVNVPPPDHPAAATGGDSLPHVRAVADTAAPATVRVLSFNVRIFNFYQSLADPGYASSKAQIEWLARQPADVLCLQEYYNQVSAMPKYPFFQVTKRLDAGAFPHRAVSVAYRRDNQEFGLAIFSRFPVVRRGVLSFGKLTQNHAQWADLRRPPHAGRPADTLRVYNLHFQSMSLEEDSIVATTRRLGWLDAPGLRMLRRFRDGSVRRSRQADEVAAHIRASRYPVVVCGDFNDLPYSYTYSVFNNFLLNAHQTVGAGPGATYAGRLPLLRIDHQFSTPGRLLPVWVKVHDEVAWSDHYPLEAVYQVQPARR